MPGWCPKYVASVNCAVSICQVNETHDGDALLHTPKVGLLFLRFYSTSTTKLRNNAATKKSESDALRATENNLCAVLIYAQSECVAPHLPGFVCLAIALESLTSSPLDCL